MILSKKQIEYTENANHRWNIKSGAVRSGKSFVDIANIIPERIITRIKQPGLAVILGVSRESIERNVLQPMREIYTPSRIGNINSSNNIASLFGQDVYCLGAEKVSQVAKIQGSSIKYAYGDEVAKWNREVFEMLKSRLDKPYSCFDGACNPETPTHWLKRFLDSGADIYLQEYTIFDNPYLPKEFIDNLCREYEGTIYYDRYICGLWKRAEGSIYRRFADCPDGFIVSVDKGEASEINIGLDFGGNSSGHALVASGYLGRYDQLVGLVSKRIMQKDVQEPIDSNMLDRIVLEFIGLVQKKYGAVECIYWDNAESVLGNSIRNAVERKYPDIIVRPAKKKHIKDRIECLVRMMGSGRFYITEDCESLSTALQDAVWDKKQLTEDVRLDDGSTDIDTLDAFEYTYERDMDILIDRRS
ncbi:PBSX family phage terminase large subunit [Clostridiales Family XIII bacterium ASD5510]|uniref:PBSX family phage terminase large subunit n=1 Tax=Hominibacterium faecale TaxID=2839743 RepID=A0A9J6QZA3_9FIRM|nr:PBSX family phage terminase large subunit [Hominibacterium faecale]MCU7380841.1 PBSX family phage terminase large subunit [Hominibacterium faecale]